MTHGRSPSHTRADWKLRAPLLALAALPFVLSLVVHIKGPTAQSAEQRADRWPLVFSQYMVNLGPIRAEDRFAQAYFAFTNTGLSPITLKEPQPSCSCINPRLKDQKQTYAPGEGGRLYVSLDTTKEPPGDREYSIAIPYEIAGDTRDSAATKEQPRVREVGLTFKVTLPDSDVVVQPRGVAILQSADQETTRTVRVIDRRDTPLDVLKVESSSARVSAQIVHTGPDEDGYRNVVIEITARGAVPNQRVFETVTIHTGDEKYATLKVPVMIAEPDWSSAGRPSRDSAPRPDREARAPKEAQGSK